MAVPRVSQRGKYSKLDSEYRSLVWYELCAVNIVTDLLKALRNSGHAVPQRVTSGNSRDCATVGNGVLLGGRQRTNEMPG
jgi:hypothetical protein